MFFFLKTFSNIKILLCKIIWKTIEQFIQVKVLYNNPVVFRFILDQTGQADGANFQIFQIAIIIIYNASNVT